MEEVPFNNTLQMLVMEVLEPCLILPITNNLRVIELIQFLEIFIILNSIKIQLWLILLEELKMTKFIFLETTIMMIEVKKIK
jgi:hypothetical protein